MRHLSFFHSSFSILIDSVFPNYYIFIGRFDNENAQNVDGSHAHPVGNNPVSAAS